MDYTVRTWNNLKPGSYNLNLLETLYGTPTQPITSDPLAGEVPEEGTPVPPSTPLPPFGPRPPQPRPNWGNDNDEEEEENEDDRRQRQRRLHSKVSTLMEMCQGMHCVHTIDDEYMVVINKQLV